MAGDRGSRRHGNGARNCSGHNLPGPRATCPLTTTYKLHSSEVAGSDEGELRAYKLGKKRWSYNQCELRFQQEGGSQQLEVVECMQYGPSTLSELEKESGVTYQVRLANGYRIRVNIFIVYDEATEMESPEGEALLEHSKPQRTYQWTSLSRDACKKGCEGPVLRSIQRFGRLGRRSGQLPEDAQNGKDKVKEAKYMYLSIDEAGTHVNFRRFRLVAGAYDSHGQNLLGTALSPPIRVLANNDVPTGAAFIPLTIEVRADWDGWSEPVKTRPRLPLLQAEPAQQEKTRSLSSNETEYSGGGGAESIIQRRREPIGPLPGMLLNHALGSTDSPTLLNAAPIGSPGFWGAGDTATSDTRAGIAGHLLSDQELSQLQEFGGPFGSSQYTHLNGLGQYDTYTFNGLMGGDGPMMSAVPRLAPNGANLEGLNGMENRESPPSSHRLQTASDSPDLSAMSNATYGQLSPQMTARSVHSRSRSTSERQAMQPISSRLKAHPAQEQMIMRREAMRQKTDALLGEGGHEQKRVKTEDEAALLGEDPRLNSWDSNAVLSFQHLGAPLHNAFDNQNHFYGAADWCVLPSNVMSLHGSDSVSPYEVHYDRQQSMQASMLSPFGPALGGGSTRLDGGVATMSAADIDMSVRIDEHPYPAEEKRMHYHSDEQHDA